MKNIDVICPIQKGLCDEIIAVVKTCPNMDKDGECKIIKESEAIVAKAMRKVK